MKELRIMVNWMHGAAHELGCELENSARFKEGAARRVGENVEQVWSLLKVRCHSRLLFLNRMGPQGRSAQGAGNPCVHGVQATVHSGLISNRVLGCWLWSADA